jgi:hypothetical protein
MPEWLKGADCKSASESLRWFESISTHHLILKGLREIVSPNFLFGNSQLGRNWADSAVFDCPLSEQFVFCLSKPRQLNSLKCPRPLKHWAGGGLFSIRGEFQGRDR